MEKRYLGKVELDDSNTTVTAWEVKSEKEGEEDVCHLITVFEIAGSPGWTWAFGIDWLAAETVKGYDPGSDEMYRISSSEDDIQEMHEKVLDAALHTGFITKVLKSNLLAEF